MTTIEPRSLICSYSIEKVCIQLGVPQKDWHLFRRWAGKCLTTEALDKLHAYVDVMIADRCCKPGTDLLSQLIANGVDGEELTVDELHTAVAALVARARRSCGRLSAPRQNTGSRTAKSDDQDFYLGDEPIRCTP
jgi:hypothetical protein